MAEDKKPKRGCQIGCLGVVIVFLIFLIIGISNSGNTQTSQEVKDYISKANTFYSETGAYIQGFTENTNAENYEENRQNLMHMTSDLNERIGAEINKIPEDTTDPGLSVARQALKADSEICMALYATLATNDPSGAEIINQKVQAYNDLKPELEKYQ